MNNSLHALPLMLALAVLTACTRPKPPPASPPKVTAIHPQMGTVTNWDEFPGHVEAVEMVEIRPRVSGYVESIHFEDGAVVKTGDRLFEIDPRPYQAEVDRTKAERQRAEARLELSRNDLKRAESLRDTKAISEEEYDSRSKAVRETEAALAAAKAADAAAQLNLDYTHLKAPINGRIGRRLVTVGNLVQGGGMMPGTILTTMVSLDPVYCHFDADEASFRRYRNRDHPGAGSSQDLLECNLALVDEEAFPHKGRVDFFDNQVNPKTGTIRMRGVFANPDGALVPGMFARIRVLAGPPVQAMLVPAVAIASDQGQKYVLIVNQDNVVEPKPIQAGRQHGAMRVVTDGLKLEDRVIINGLMMARPGGKVEIVDAPPKGATASR